MLRRTIGARQVSITILLAVAGALVAAGSLAGSGGGPLAAGPSPQVERGRYLVDVAVCNDCHSPKVFTPEGPVPDPNRILSGHPHDAKTPEIPAGVLGPGKWGALSNEHFTAWVGPWGVSYAINLTPDIDTGIGSWTEAMFIKALRTGKHFGESRPILPPMPWPSYGKMTDEDLKAVFAYLRSIPAVRNAVPDPKIAAPAK